MAKALHNEQIKQLRGQCHALQAVVMIAGDGLTDNIIHDIKQALLAHELIKIRIRADRVTRSTITARILQHTGAIQVMTIGQVLCIYQRHPEQPRLLQ